MHSKDLVQLEGGKGQLYDWWATIDSTMHQTELASNPLLSNRSAIDQKIAGELLCFQLLVEIDTDTHP